MDTILVVNAGSSSVKFQVFRIDGGSELSSLVKGQIDGIGTRPHLYAKAADISLVDRAFRVERIANVQSALHAAGGWLRDELRIDPIAVGHRVAHGGPRYDKPALIDRGVIADLERYVPLAPLHQPNNLASIRVIL